MNEHDEIIVNAIKKALQLTGKDKIKFSRGMAGKCSWDVNFAMKDDETLQDYKGRIVAADAAMASSFINEKEVKN